MTPREHYLAAENALARATEVPLDEPEVCLALVGIGQLHALLAQIGTPLSWQATPARPLDGAGRPL